MLGYLPSHQRRKITRYTAFEPNGLFDSTLQGWLRPAADDAESPLPCLERPLDIHRRPFAPDSSLNPNGTDNNSLDDAGEQQFDLILFCHSMYGMKPKHEFIHRALELLVERSRDGLVVVFHRDALRLDGLVCHRRASFPTGLVRVAHNDDEALDCFAAFIAGFTTPDNPLQAAWRDVCRALGRCGELDGQDHLLFSAPDVMVALTRQAIALPELLAEVPVADTERMVKNSEARRHCPAVMVRPDEVRHIQECVRWALRNNVGLTVVGGGHSGHCVWSNVVAVDMGAFNQVHVLAAGKDSESESLVIAEAGATTDDIIRKIMAAGLTVPLGARPSVGAGLWLQGGIGHLARQQGLACDAIVGAIMVSVESGDILCIGHVPNQHRPAGSVSVEDDDHNLLWAIGGAGTNFGIMVSVTLNAYAAPTYSVRNWIVPLMDRHEARQKLSEFDEFVARNLPSNCSADAYLYYSEDNRLRLGVTLFETSTPTGITTVEGTPSLPDFSPILGPQASFKTMDAVDAFEAEMYISGGMHGGHGGGKTSSFKRCVFLKHIGQANVGDILLTALETRPTSLCYLHLLQGGKAVADVPADSTAFGCRDWDFACVITGVWARHQDGTKAAAAAVRWVYNVAGHLLPLSSGAYGADLRPDPRDAALAAKAFGPNLPRLARLKRDRDPFNLLAYACPLPRTPMEPKFIILVRGESGAGKDYCADVWVRLF